MPALNALLNLLFPPQCLACDALVGAQGALCEECWKQIHFIADPFCACCGMPFPYDYGGGSLCAECLREHPPFTRARSVLAYNEASRKLALRLKFQDETSFAVTYGKWLAGAGRELVESSDVIVPVPLHYWRFVKRRYNQAALLAQALQKQCALPLVVDGLMRVKATKQQTGLSRKERQRNLRGAFRVHPKHAGRLKGQTVLLVDDVYTTGATLSACAKALVKNGAASVQVLTLARRGLE